MSDGTGRAATVGWWGVLLATVALFVFLTSRQAGPSATASVSERSNPVLKILGQYIVGAHNLIECMPSTGEDQGAAFLAQLDGNAHSLGDRIRLVPVAGELKDSGEARARADRLAAETGLTPGAREDLSLLRQIYDEEEGEMAPADRDRLVDRYGWFGRLALSHGLDDEDPLRQSVLAEARRTMIAVITIFLGGIAAGIAGLVLFIIACVRLGSGKLRFSYEAPPATPRDRIWLETLVVFLVALLVIGGLVSEDGLIGLDRETVLTVLLALFPLWPLWRGVPRAEWRSALGLHRGRGVWREIGCGLLGYLAGLPIFIAGVVLTMVIVALTGADLSHPGIEESSAEGSFGFLRLLVLACVWAPVVEELIFRGAFYRYMRSRTSTVLSAMVVGLFFAAVHPQGYAAIPALMSLGIVFALLRQWRASIIAPMTAHALHNFILVSALFFLL